MILGRVIGAITSTINHPFYDAKKLLVVERTDATGAPLADYLVAVDTVDAGVGDAVLVLDEGTGARQVFASKDAPVRSVIVGIVDHVSLR
jgi:microcompartment protein CcmK/EutM